MVKAKMQKVFSIKKSLFFEMKFFKPSLLRVHILHACSTHTQRLIDFKLKLLTQALQQAFEKICTIVTGNTSLLEKTGVLFDSGLHSV